MHRHDLLQFDVAHAARQKRWLLFLRTILAFPHSIILWFLTFGLSIVSFIAWWAILFTGRYPEGLWNFSMSVMRWNARVQVYVMSLRDEYPPFGEGPYPMTFELAYPERQSRLLLFLRPFMLIPHYVCLIFVGFAAGIVYLVAWFAVLFLGRMPEGMFSFLVGTYRWMYRVYVYQLMLTDAYPPFSLDEGQMASGTSPAAYAGHA
jgi:hypothetical protein